MNKQKILIIGSGLSGLSCATYLDKNIYDVSIYEKSDTPGGRVSSEIVEGNICDVGFQVLLNNYDEVKKLGVYNSLNLKYFDSGAEIYHNGRILSIYSPLRHPFKFIKSNITKMFSASDVFSLIKSLFVKSDLKHANQYINKNFSDKSQKLFFYPFFRGVFLSKELHTDINFFLKIFKKFAFGAASLPSHGMRMLPKEIIKKHNLNINYNRELKNIEAKKAIFVNNVEEHFDKIVLAMPINNLKEITNIDIEAENNFNKTAYIKSSKSVLNKAIMLIADDQYKINSIQCLSNISKNYSADSDHLYSISCLKNIDDQQLISEFKSITKVEDKDIKLIKSYTINEALPARSEDLDNKDNIYFCGDWKSEASIDGAIKSGRLCAEEINKSQ